VIAKRRDSPYEHRRSPLWLKMKCEATQELVLGGFTDPQGKRVGLGALLLGYYEGDDFVFAGKVGTGLDTKLLLELRERLDGLEIAAPGCHAWARTGCGPGSWCRSRSRSGRCTGSSDTRGCSGSVRTSPRARS
jgi:ATP-dependent DNA ligase